MNRTPRIELTKIKNLSTGTELLNSRQSVEVVEHKEQSVIFHAEVKAFPNQLVALEGQIHFQTKTVPFKATGRIVTVHSGSDSLNRFEIHLNQYEKSTWNRYLQELGETQGKADRIFSGVRGDE